jgi:phosphodiesterase/alkaline phosphatase D-like protein
LPSLRRVAASIGVDMPTQEELKSQLRSAAERIGNEASRTAVIEFLSQRAVDEIVFLTGRINVAYQVIQKIKDGEATKDQISKNEDGSFELMPPPTPIPSGNGKKEPVAAKEPVTA